MPVLGVMGLHRLVSADADERRKFMRPLAISFGVPVMLQQLPYRLVLISGRSRQTVQPHVHHLAALGTRSGSAFYIRHEK